MTGALVVGVPTATARAATPERTADKPAKWDPRIVEYVQFVERERGLTFEHPIPVDFLSDKKFIKVLQGDDHKPTKAERTAAEHYAGQLRALGLVEGHVDLIGANEDLDAASVTGFYRDRTKRMVIRGTDISDVVTRVTVVHELTHALQDQHFDLNRLGNLARSTSEDFALTALIEGDASYVEEAYYFSLTPAEQAEYDNWDPAEHGARTAPDESTGADIPPVLDLLQSAPYIFGVRFVAFLDGENHAAIDNAFSNRPTSEEQVIDPIAYMLHEEPVNVPAPTLAEGEEADGQADVFGAFSLYVMLAGRLDPKIALAASEGWGGDRYRAFRRDGKECVRLDVAGDTATDSSEIGAAFDQWATTMPTGAVSVGHESKRTQLTACESTAAAPSRDTLDAAVTLLTIRNEVLDGVVRRAKPTKGSRCVADKAVTNPALEQLLEKSELSDAEQALVASQLKLFASQCGV